MQGYDGAIQPWLANLISCRVAPYFMTIRPCRVKNYVMIFDQSERALGPIYILNVNNFFSGNLKFPASFIVFVTIKWVDWNRKVLKITQEWSPKSNLVMKCQILIFVELLLKTFGKTRKQHPTNHFLQETNTHWQTTLPNALQSYFTQSDYGTNFDKKSTNCLRLRRQFNRRI